MYKTYNNIRKIGTGQADNNTIDCLLNFKYSKGN